MPIKSEQQRRFMAMCLHSPEKAKDKCPPKNVAKKFIHGHKRKDESFNYYKLFAVSLLEEVSEYDRFNKETIQYDPLGVPLNPALMGGLKKPEPEEPPINVNKVKQANTQAGINKIMNRGGVMGKPFLGFIGGKRPLGLRFLDKVGGAAEGVGNWLGRRAVANAEAAKQRQLAAAEAAKQAELKADFMDTNQFDLDQTTLNTPAAPKAKLHSIPPNEEMINKAKQDLAKIYTPERKAPLSVNKSGNPIYPNEAKPEAKIASGGGNPKFKAPKLKPYEDSGVRKAVTMHFGKPASYINKRK